MAGKVGKKLLRDNTGPGGSLDTDKFMRAVMQYRNTPMQSYKYELAKDWNLTQKHRERTLATKRELDNKR